MCTWNREILNGLEMPQGRGMPHGFAQTELEMPHEFGMPHGLRDAARLRDAAPVRTSCGSAAANRAGADRRIRTRPRCRLHFVPASHVEMRRKHRARG